MSEMLLSVERLRELLKHESPVVREWAWKRLEEIYPREMGSALFALKEEKNIAVFKKALLGFQHTLAQISPEGKEELKTFLTTCLESSERRDLYIPILAVLSQLVSLGEFFKSHPDLLDKIFEDEELLPPFLERVVFTLSPKEAAPFMARFEGHKEIWNSWEAFYAGYLVRSTTDPSPINKVYPRLRAYLSHFLEGLSVVLPEDDYFLSILPEEAFTWWSKLSKTSARRRFRKFVEEKFRKLKEEVLGRRGELALRRHLERPDSLGPVFGGLETLLEVSRGDISEPVVQALGKLLLTLLWGKPLLGLPENSEKEELFDLYFDEERPVFPEDDLLCEKILVLLQEKPATIEEIRTRLREVLSGDSYGAERGVKLARKCGTTFLPEIMQFYRLFIEKQDLEKPEYIEEAVRDFVHLSEVREELRKLAREFRHLSPFFILRYYPDKTTAEELARDFDFWLENSYDSLSLVVPAFPYHAIWEKMKNSVHPETPGWREPFVIFARLLEPDFSGLDTLEKEVLAKERKLQEMFDTFKIPDPSREEILFAFKCRTCGFLFPFSAKKIFVLEDEIIEFPEKVICPRCREENFEVPEGEFLKVWARLLLASKKQKDRDEWEDTIVPLKFFLSIFRGREYQFQKYHEALSFYRRWLEREPEDPELLSGYLFLLLRGRRLMEVEQVFSRLEAAAGETVDLFYLRAIYYRLQAKPKEALEFYHKALEALAHGKPFYRFYPRDRREIMRAILREAKDYARRKEFRFHFKEIEEVAKRKVGRNDPCPCGSGKKYKKCCLRRTKNTV